MSPTPKARAGRRPQVKLLIGTAERWADYASGSGSDTHVFEYEITNQDFDDNGISITGPVRLNGASLTDDDSNAVTGDLTFTAVSNASGHDVLTPISDTSAIIPKDSNNRPIFGHGEKFRLLFVSSNSRNADSADIADYNTHVQARAADDSGADAAVEGIRAFSAKFRAVASTDTVDARDNTATTATTGASAPIYWLSGEKVADGYADFYSGAWELQGGQERVGRYPQAGNSLDRLPDRRHRQHPAPGRQRHHRCNWFPDTGRASGPGIHRHLRPVLLRRQER